MAIPAKNSPQAASEPHPEGLWGVKDSNAKTAPRVHEPVEGHFYELHAIKWTYMPAAHASKFLCDSAFIVIDEGSNKQNALPQSEVAQAGVKRLQIEPGQCIANFGELSVKSLLARAVRLPGGEKFTPKSKADDLVKFLTDVTLQTNVEDDEALDEDGVDGAMDMSKTFRS